MKPHVAILSLKARMDWLLSKNRNDHRLSQQQTETNGCRYIPLRWTETICKSAIRFWTTHPFDVDVLYRHFKSALICLTNIGQKECHPYISADLYRKLDAFGEKIGNQEG